MGENETELGGEIASAIEGAIEDANAQTEAAVLTANAIADAAMETERGRRIETLEREFEQWQENQNEQAQAIAALVLGQTEISAQLSLLVAQSTPQPLPTQNPQSAVAGGQQESQDLPALPAVTAPEAPAPAMETQAAPAPKKKRFRLI